MKVYYMNGAGNDFMVIDARGLTLDYPALARKCCAITGADGFMATDISDKADFRLHFYNSDRNLVVLRCITVARLIFWCTFLTGVK